MSKRPKMLNRRYKKPPKASKYAAGSWFCGIRVPIIDVAARVKRMTMVSRTDVKKSHILLKGSAAIAWLPI